MVFESVQKILKVRIFLNSVSLGILTFSEFLWDFGILKSTKFWKVLGNRIVYLLLGNGYYIVIWHASNVLFFVEHNFLAVIILCSNFLYAIFHGFIFCNSFHFEFFFISFFISNFLCTFKTVLFWYHFFMMQKFFLCNFFVFFVLYAFSYTFLYTISICSLFIHVFFVSSKIHNDINKILKIFCFIFWNRNR